MAIGLAIEAPPDHHHYNAKVTPFLVMSCVVAATGGLMFGYDVGISGGVTSMEPFLKRFFPEVYRRMEEDVSVSNYCKFNSQLLTAFTSSLYVSGLLTTFFSSKITRQFGRRASMLVSGAAYLAGTVLGGGALDVYMLILGRVLLGVGVGFANQAVPLYLSEMAPPRYRGAFNSGFQVCTSIGFLLASFINYGTQKIEGGWGWRVSLSLAGIPASILTLGTLFLPDTPNSVVQRTGNIDKTKKLLQKLRGVEDVDVELNDLISASNNPVDHKNSLIIVSKRKYIPHLVMAVAIPFFQQVTGINVIGFYAPILYRTIGMGESASLLTSAVLSGVVGTFFTVVSMVVVDKVGRRALFMIGGILMLVTLVIAGGIFAAQLGDHGDMDKGYAIAVTILLSIYVIGFGLSWGPLGWLVPSEIFALEIRSAGQSIAVSVSLLLTFIIAQTFLSMLCNFKSGTFFFFGSWVAVMTVFVHLLLPETKNKPIEQMEQVWREHWFWKRIVLEDYDGKQPPQYDLDPLPATKQQEHALKSEN